MTKLIAALAHLRRKGGLARNASATRRRSISATVQPPTLVGEMSSRKSKGSKWLSLEEHAGQKRAQEIADMKHARRIAWAWTLLGTPPALLAVARLLQLLGA